MKMQGMTKPLCLVNFKRTHEMFDNIDQSFSYFIIRYFFYSAGSTMKGYRSSGVWGVFCWDIELLLYSITQKIALGPLSTKVQFLTRIHRKSRWMECTE